MNLTIDLAVQKYFLTYLVDLSRDKIVLEYLHLNRIIIETRRLNAIPWDAWARERSIGMNWEVRLAPLLIS